MLSLILDVYTHFSSQTLKCLLDAEETRAGISTRVSRMSDLTQRHAERKINAQMSIGRRGCGGNGISEYEMSNMSIHMTKAHIVWWLAVVQVYRLIFRPKFQNVFSMYSGHKA